ncbi:carbon-nitrogen hydrolase family protein [Nonomuraea pusilla]|uniref:Predicted amidohydrolase n=1 Tax=Nonomuraea pusilla TaxID=46177 RepID=A0A1H8F7Q6_9ACTN|nr:carbon-nitrogen hydrolase family protein [Nonomuraea pusilla]SEN27424.1 Predicted amidohydrolase [Nonomuraea pusilla]
MRVLLIQPSRWSPDGHANFDAAERLLASSGSGSEGPVACDSPLGGGDVVLLPELAGSDLTRPDYLARVRDLAAGTGLTVVGGSHHDRTPDGTVNRGAVADPTGAIVAEYAKAHPYGVEHESGVVPGDPGGAFTLGGRRLRVLLCADLWYSSSLTGGDDVVLVPAFSVTRWDGPAAARALWRHMSVARAYEFMAYVAVSDWRHEADYHGRPCAGVTGFADPCPADPSGFHVTPSAPVSVRALDFDRLDAFRADRAARGFAPRPAGSQG